jgi:hypothetical protein
MKVRTDLRTCVVPILQALCASPTAAQPGEEEGLLPQLSVRLTPGSDINAILDGYDLLLHSSFAPRELFLLAPRRPSDLMGLFALLSADERIQWVELNVALSIAPGGGTQSFFLSRSRQAFDDQYPRTLAGIDAAHAIGRGAQVVVAVLDTGVSPSHALLAPRLVAGGFNVIAGSPDTSDAGNGLDDDGDGTIDELAGHGTFVASLVAMVAPEVGILPVSVLNSDGVGSSFAVAQGIYHAIDAGAGVINLSLSSLRDSLSVQEAVDEARAAGIIVVAAVGNDGMPAPVYPAAGIGVVGVASTDAADLKSSFSDYGQYVVLSAPGTGVVGALPGDQYAEGSGASYAAAMVSGAAAILRSILPAATPDSVAALLRQSAAPIDAINPLYAGMLGAGRLNVHAAAQAAAPPSPADFNADGLVNSADFFDFLTSFFMSNADFNRDGLTNSQDFFDYLAIFFMG